MSLHLGGQGGEGFLDHLFGRAGRFAVGGEVVGRMVEGRRKVVDGHGVVLLPPQEGDAAVLDGGGQVGHEVLFGQVVLALVPDVDERLLDDVFRVVAV